MESAGETVETCHRLVKLLTAQHDEGGYDMMMAAMQKNIRVADFDARRDLLQEDHKTSLRNISRGHSEGFRDIVWNIMNAYPQKRAIPHETMMFRGTDCLELGCEDMVNMTWKPGQVFQTMKTMPTSGNEDALDEYATSGFASVAIQIRADEWPGVVRVADFDKGGDDVDDDPDDEYIFPPYSTFRIDEVDETEVDEVNMPRLHVKYLGCKKEPAEGVDFVLHHLEEMMTENVSDMFADVMPNLELSDLETHDRAQRDVTGKRQRTGGANPRRSRMFSFAAIALSAVCALSSVFPRCP